MTWSTEMTWGGAGMTEGGARTAASPVMAVRTEVAPEACNSSPGNANLRIGIQAGQEKDSHSNPQRKYALRHALSVIPAYAAVMSPLRRHARPPASFLRRQES